MNKKKKLLYIHIYIVQCNSLIVKKKEQSDVFFGRFKIFLWIRFFFCFL